MNTIQNIQLFELQNFALDHWEVVRERNSAAIAQASVGNGTALVWPVSEWIEAVMWLALGAELGIFPAGGCDKLLTGSITEMANVFDICRSDLQILFPWKVVEWINGVLHANAIIQPDQFSAEKQSARPHFRAALALCTHGLHDSTALRFQELLALRWPEYWNSDINGPVSLPAVVDTVVNDTQWDDISVESLVAGFIKTADAMVVWQEFFENVLTDDLVEFGDRTRLARLIGQTTGWRLNLHVERTKERFREIAMLSESVLIDLERLGSIPVDHDREVFLARIEKLMDDWQHSHPFYETSMGSGAR
jgi:hypothetical protein